MKAYLTDKAVSIINIALLVLKVLMQALGSIRDTSKKVIFKMLP
jgi:hypothetical protein